MTPNLGGRVICDNKGTPLYRKIGFEGGLISETKPVKAGTIYCVSGTFVDVSDTEGAEAEPQGGADGKP